MIGQEIQACCVVGAGTVTRGVGSGRGIPPGSRSQFLGGTCTRVGNQFAPFRIARDMPTHRTDTSHTARIGRRGGSSVHSHCPSIGFSCIGSIGTRSAVGDGRVVGSLGNLQIFLEPALTANHHGIVRVAVNVGNGGQARTGLTVLHRVEGLGLAVGSIDGVNGVGTIVVLGVGGKIGNGSTIHCLRKSGVPIPTVTFDRSGDGNTGRGSHDDAVFGNRHTAVVGNLAAQNPGTVLGNITNTVDGLHRGSIHCVILSIGITADTTDTIEISVVYRPIVQGIVRTAKTIFSQIRRP